MTNKEIQDYLKQWDDDFEVPDHISLQIMQLSSHFYKQHEEKSK